MFAHLVLISLYYVYYTVHTSCIPPYIQFYAYPQLCMLYIAYNCMLNPMALVIPLDFVYISLCNTQCVVHTVYYSPLPYTHREKYNLSLCSLVRSLSLSLMCLYVEFLVYQYSITHIVGNTQWHQRLQQHILGLLQNLSIASCTSYIQSTYTV